MKNEYFANGKLLITGEYVVLDGAESLAFPCKFGQKLICEFTQTETIQWNSFDVEGQCWFSATYTNDLQLVNTTDVDKAHFLQSILSYCLSKTTSSIKAQLKSGACFSTYLSFPNNWGLGSSSTLIVIIADFFNINAFDLHFSQTKGSGYDIACGTTNCPIIYQLENEQHLKIKHLPKTVFDTIKDSIFFVHLNQKQKSDKEVAAYSVLKKDVDLMPFCNEISNLTHQLIQAKNLSVFNELLETHEALLSNLLQRNTIKEELFQLYKGGAIKSLGAWGGDFIMVTGTQQDLDYFRDKNYTTILSFDEMIL